MRYREKITSFVIQASSMPKVDESASFARDYSVVPGVHIRTVEQAKADAHNCEFFCTAAYPNVNNYGWNEGSLA